MSSRRQRQYAAVPVHDQEEDQLEQAFAGSDNEDDGNNARDIRPLLTPSVYGPRTGSRTPRTVSRITDDGQYNFEYEYGPPPGSPPRDLAVPNHWGNTNGILVSYPTNYDPNTQGNWFSRTWRSMFGRKHRETLDKVVGSGINNDGVFANLASRPTRNEAPRNQISIGNNGPESDDRNFAPEYALSDAPPSYRAALADNAPPYWENTVLTTVGDDFLVDSIPTGSIFGFIGAALISIFLEWFGFIIAFVLSQTHAGRYGARAGLGITFIRFGFWFRTKGGVLDTKEGLTDDLWWSLPDGNMTVSHWNYSHPFMFVNGTLQFVNGTLHYPRTIHLNTTSHKHGHHSHTDFLPFADWLAIFLMIIGWFIFMSSVFGFWRIKRWEHSIRASNSASNNEQQPPTQVFVNYQSRPLPSIPVGHTPPATASWQTYPGGVAGGMIYAQHHVPIQSNGIIQHEESMRQHTRVLGYP